MSLTIDDLVSRADDGETDVDTGLPDVTLRELVSDSDLVEIGIGSKLVSAEHVRAEVAESLAASMSSLSGTSITQPRPHVQFCKGLTRFLLRATSEDGTVDDIDEVSSSQRTATLLSSMRRARTHASVVLSSSGDGSSSEMAQNGMNADDDEVSAAGHTNEEEVGEAQVSVWTAAEALCSAAITLRERLQHAEREEAFAKECLEELKAKHSSDAAASPAHATNTNTAVREASPLSADGCKDSAMGLGQYSNADKQTLLLKLEEADRENEYLRGALEGAQSDLISTRAELARLNDSEQQGSTMDTVGLSPRSATPKTPLQTRHQRNIPDETAGELFGLRQQVVDLEREVQLLRGALDQRVVVESRSATVDETTVELCTEPDATESIAPVQCGTARSWTGSQSARQRKTADIMGELDQLRAQNVELSKECISLKGALDVSLRRGLSMPDNSNGNHEDYGCSKETLLELRNSGSYHQSVAEVIKQTSPPSSITKSRRLQGLLRVDWRYHQQLLQWQAGRNVLFAEFDCVDPHKQPVDVVDAGARESEEQHQPLHDTQSFANCQSERDAEWIQRLRELHDKYSGIYEKWAHVQRQVIELQTQHRDARDRLAVEVGARTRAEARYAAMTATVAEVKLVGDAECAQLRAALEHALRIEHKDDDAIFKALTEAESAVAALTVERDHALALSQQSREDLDHASAQITQRSTSESAELERVRETLASTMAALAVTEGKLGAELKACGDFRAEEAALRSDLCERDGAIAKLGLQVDTLTREIDTLRQEHDAYVMETNQLIGKVRTTLTPRGDSNMRDHAAIDGADASADASADAAEGLAGITDFAQLEADSAITSICEAPPHDELTPNAVAGSM